jgi:hypothetical protein
VSLCCLTVEVMLLGIAPAMGWHFEVGPIGVRTARLRYPSYELGLEITEWDEGWVRVPTSRRLVLVYLATLMAKAEQA